MVLENLQGVLYFITLIFALFTAVLGIISVNVLFRDKLKELFSNTFFFIFFFLIFGYVCFALAELSWYLIFDVFEQDPSVSIPDLYWIVGSFFLLIAFFTLTIHLHRNHGDSGKIISLLILAAVVLGGVVFFVNVIGLTETGKSSGHIFLGYFYPIISSLILVFSSSILFFNEKIELFNSTLSFLFLANVAFLAADLLYTLITVKETYGTAGVLSDLGYILAYLLCGLAFLALLFKARDYQNNKEIKG